MCGMLGIDGGLLHEIGSARMLLRLLRHVRLHVECIVGHHDGGVVGGPMSADKGAEINDRLRCSEEGVLQQVRMYESKRVGYPCRDECQECVAGDRRWDEVGRTRW